MKPKLINNINGSRVKGVKGFYSDYWIIVGLTKCQSNTCLIDSTSLSCGTHLSLCHTVKSFLFLRCQLKIKTPFKVWPDWVWFGIVQCCHELDSNTNNNIWLMRYPLNHGFLNNHLNLMLMFFIRRQTSLLLEFIAFYCEMKCLQTEKTTHFHTMSIDHFPKTLKIL